jgi:hypothetical protein
VVAAKVEAKPAVAVVVVAEAKADTKMETAMVGPPSSCPPATQPLLPPAQHLQLAATLACAVGNPRLAHARPAGFRRLPWTHACCSLHARTHAQSPPSPGPQGCAVLTTAHGLHAARPCLQAAKPDMKMPEMKMPEMKVPGKL